MATYAIGDVQGCYYSLQDLIKKIPFDSTKDKLWFVGDIVNRGKFSLETLSWCYENQKNIKIVLGNHDLHFLAISFNQRSPNKTDTLNSLLKSKDKNKLAESWRTLQSSYAPELDDLHAIYQEVDLSGVTFYRIKAGFYDTQQQAKESCKILKKMGANCIVSNQVGMRVI